MSAVVLDAPPTLTSRDQLKTEQAVIGCFKAFLAETGTPSAPEEGIRLDRERHVTWLQRGLRQLPTNFCGLDASRPWFVYWISHALEMLDEYDEDIWASSVASFLGKCQDPSGGFGGGPSQLPHLAPTYAAVAALMVAGREVAYQTADREKTYNFLMRMKTSQGGFMMHEEGETDMRGTYCAVAVASMLNILTDELIEGVPEYVSGCQSFEGGIAGEAGLEAHGGYSYCGLAALCIIGKADALDLDALLHWVCGKQMALEGGFAGRANKLVDSCYAFWLGATFPLLYEAFHQQQRPDCAATLPGSHLWFAPRPLQTYVLLACQHNGGGLRDKPGKSADFYHTCYALSGVASTQHGLGGEKCIVGDAANELGRIDVFYNVLLEKSQRRVAFFEKAPPFQFKGREIQGREGDGVAASRRRLLAESAE